MWLIWLPLARLWSSFFSFHVDGVRLLTFPGSPCDPDARRDLGVEWLNVGVVTVEDGTLNIEGCN